MHISAYYITLNIKQQFMHAAFCSIFHSSDIFWPVWCLIHLGSFGIIWERSIEKCQWLEDGWRWLKHVKAVYSSFKAKPLRSSRLRLPAAWPKLLVRSRVLSCLIIDLCLICLTVQYDSNFTWYVLQYCLSVYVRLVFLKVSGMMFVQGCPGSWRRAQKQGTFWKGRSPTV